MEIIKRDNNFRWLNCFLFLVRPQIIFAKTSWFIAMDEEMREKVYKEVRLDSDTLASPFFIIDQTSIYIW